MNQTKSQSTHNSETKIQLCLPFYGKQEVQLPSILKKRILSNMKVCVIFEETKLPTQFLVKDKLSLSAGIM